MYEDDSIVIDEETPHNEDVHSPLSLPPKLEGHANQE